jgi:rfaE bifunctional protein kinase chain/domain
LPAYDVVLMSDYGKGGLTHIKRMIDAARAEGKPVLIDPKGDDFQRYRGATLLTPNRAELRAVLGRWRDEDDLTSRVTALMTDLDLDALLLTRSEEGMSLFDAQGRFDVAAQAREVYDVTGAGDTVIGTLGVMLAGGLTLREAVLVANRAAGIVVGKLGTSVVTQAELFGREGTKA